LFVCAIDPIKTISSDYFSIMLDVIDRCGGDVVKFCGDAVIIMWYATLSATVEAREACILKASLCALQLIESCGDYSKPLVGKDNTTGILEGGFIVTDSSATSSHASHEAGKDAVDLSLHCGISSGIVHCMILGRGERREFIVSGPAIESMGKAEASADKNEVCVTMDCKLVLEKYFVLDPAKNLGEHSGYYILKAELKHQEPKNADRDFPTPSTRKGSVISIAASHLVNRSKSLFQYAPRSGTSEGYDHDSSSILSVAEIMHLFSTARDPILREVVKYNVTPNFSHEDEYRKVQPSMQYQEVMKSFLHSTALSAVESHTYALLSEMRNIVTVFLSLHGLEVSLEQGLFDDVQEIFLLLLSTLDLHNGSLRQFVVDDKGCVAIVCFGLFGCNTTNNSLNALKFSVDFQQLIQQRQLSLCGGITCGRVYCGNVGSIRRCEFAVMGASVNLAARLMSACKGKGQFILVTEDIKNETMGSHAFVQTTSIVAKGYDHPIHVYAPIIAKRSFGQAVIMTAGPSPVESSSECNQTTVNKFLKTIQELNDSYIQQLQPIGTDFGRKGVMNKIVFDFNESKYFPPEVEKNILILTDQIKMSRGIFGKDQKEFSSALICGHSSSGKTSLLQRLCYDLLDQGFPKSKILFVNGSHNKKNHRSEEPYSLMREFLDLLVWDTDDGEASLSRFEAAALKVESYSHSSSDVILDFEDSSSLRDALPVHAKKELNFVCDPQSTNNLLKEPDTRFNANISLKKKKDFRLFASIQTLCHDHLNTPTNFAKYVAITEFEQLSLIECINSLFESPSDDVCGQISTHFVDKLFYVLCGSHNLVDFIYSFLYGSLSFKVASTQVVDRIFIMILLMLFGVFPKTSQNKIDTSLPRLIALVDDVDSSDPSSMRIIAEVVKFLHQHTQLCEDRGELGCVIMTWTLNEGDSEARPFSSDPLDIADLDLNGSSMMARQILGRKKQDNKLSALQNKHHKRCSTKNPIFQLFEEQCHLRISMSNFSVNSIHGLLHSTLGERRWEWLLRKITGLLLKHENSATFGRRHGFVTEQLSTDRTYETNYSREREVLHEANHHIVSDIYALTNSGTPPMVFQILLSLRHAIDHGIFISIQDLPIMRQRKEKIMEWLDGLNGSELAILKAASVVGGKFSVDLLRKGLMSLDMEYCCADMVLNSALLRLRRIGIVRKSFDNTVVTSNSAKCEVHADIDHDMNDSFQFEFVDDSIRLSIYNLMLESQKAAVHGAIASYYENDYMSSKIFSQWYPICQHYMKSNAADKMTEYSWKLLQYHVSTHRHLDVIQVCGVLVSLLGAPKERIMIKQTASNIEKQIDKLPAFVFKSKMFPKNISPISALTKRMTPIRKCDDRKSFVLDNISRIFQWEVRQPNSSLFISSSNADIPSKRTHRRSSTSIRSAYLPNIGRTNRVAIDSTSGIDKDAKEELRHVDYRCGLIHHFSKELVAHHLFATSWTSSKIFKGQPTESSYLPGQFAFRTGT
jgi:class 3 adenylate cyclase